jgi:hypothetical protein
MFKLAAAAVCCGGLRKHFNDQCGISAALVQELPFTMDHHDIRTGVKASRAYANTQMIGVTRRWRERN